MSGNVACYLDEAGQVSCWGVAGTNNSRIINNVPVGVYKDIALQDDNVCALGLDGQAHCWGANAVNEPVVAFRSVTVTSTGACGIRNRTAGCSAGAATTSRTRGWWTPHTPSR